MIEAVLFDLDGTLVDSLGDLAVSMNTALHALGLPIHETQQYRQLVGNGVKELVRRAVPEERRDATTLAAVHARFSAHYTKHYADSTAPYEGIIPLLTELSARGLRLGVVSNKPDAFTKEIVRKVLAHPFDFVLGQTEALPSKPEPDMPLAALHEMGVRPVDCAYVGDSDVDMFTGRNAGIRIVVGCSWGFRGRHELTAAGADAVIDSPDELIPLLSPK